MDAQEFGNIVSQTLTVCGGRFQTLASIYQAHQEGEILPRDDERIKNIVFSMMEEVLPLIMRVGSAKESGLLTKSELLEACGDLVDSIEE
jgi:hypothetical protein